MKKESTHQPCAITELAWKHKKLIITNFCVLKFQINKSELGKHSLGLVPNTKYYKLNSYLIWFGVKTHLITVIQFITKLIKI
jgi:hypothetical protein